MNYLITALALISFNIYSDDHKGTHVITQAI